ncbi:hypothetical protein Tco_0598117 [Tanacetum coccineum]
MLPLIKKKPHVPLLACGRRTRERDQAVVLGILQQIDRDLKPTPQAIILSPKNDVANQVMLLYVMLSFSENVHSMAYCTQIEGPLRKKNIYTSQVKVVIIDRNGLYPAFRAFMDDNDFVPLLLILRYQACSHVRLLVLCSAYGDLLIATLPRRHAFMDDNDLVALLLLLKYQACRHVQLLVLYSAYGDLLIATLPREAEDKGKLYCNGLANPVWTKANRQACKAGVTMINWRILKISLGDCVPLLRQVGKGYIMIRRMLELCGNTGINETRGIVTARTPPQNGDDELMKQNLIVVLEAYASRFLFTTSFLLAEACGKPRSTVMNKSGAHALLKSTLTRSAEALLDDSCVQASKKNCYPSQATHELGYGGKGGVPRWISNNPQSDHGKCIVKIVKKVSAAGRVYEKMEMKLGRQGLIDKGKEILREEKRLRERNTAEGVRLLAELSNEQEGSDFQGDRLCKENGLDLVNHRQDILLQNEARARVNGTSPWTQSRETYMLNT